MTFFELNFIKDVQVRLVESTLYDRRIDGIWGEGSRKALLSLMSQYGDLVGKPVNMVNPLGNSVEEIFKFIKVHLMYFGFYTGELDTGYDDEMKSGFISLVANYCLKKTLPVYYMAYSKEVPLEFTTAVRQWAIDKELNKEVPNYLMAVMKFESGFDPQRQNMAGAQAFGLLQFMSAAAEDLKIPLSEIRQMGQQEQLVRCVFPYLELVMKRYGKLHTLEDFYLAVFRPKSIGSSADSVLFREGSIAYKQNRGFDKNKVGYITVGQIMSKIYDIYYTGVLPQNRRNMYG